MECSNKITTEVLYSCLDAPIMGVENASIVLINKEDIDESASTSDGAKCTAIVLKSGATGYKFEVAKSDLISASSAFAPSSEDIQGHTHTVSLRIMNPNAEAAERFNELQNGRFVAVVETRYKGTDQLDAFKVYGRHAGLEMSEGTVNTNENSGSLVFSLATKEGTVEPYPYNIFIETDYATSKATYDSVFASV